VVATSGTVTTGSIDPIEAIADVCAEQALWLHVDGAYGALFVLSEAKREALSACGRADSIALDLHKLLFAPLEAGCLLVKDREKLRRTYAFTSSYLTVEQQSRTGPVAVPQRRGSRARLVRQGRPEPQTRELDPPFR